MGPDKLRMLTDVALASHTAEYKESTREHILARNEFARRQGSGSARRSWIAIGISLVSICIAALAYYK